MYANIVFPIASFRVFIYKVPNHLQGYLHTGCAVNVLFKNKSAIGYIESLIKDSPYKGKIHSIKSVHHSQSIPKDLWKTIVWMSNYYITPIGLCIKSAIPSTNFNADNIKKDIYIQINNDKIKTINEKKFSKNQQIVVDTLLNTLDPLPIKYFQPLISNIYDVAKRLSNQGLIKKIHIMSDIDDIANIDIPRLRLSKAQNKVYDQIQPYINLNEYKGFLIHGIPGSGKTEIYIKLAQDTISKGKNVIILIPEIILTTQMKDRFLKYFGSKIAVWHSKMTLNEKRYTLKKIEDGDYNIIIGARSCIFSSLPNIGLIVIDEEQDSSYKQESPKPYYNARDIGFMRALFSNCPIVLTSATPSLETYYNSIIDKITDNAVRNAANYVSSLSKNNRCKPTDENIIYPFYLVIPYHKDNMHENKGLCLVFTYNSTVTGSGSSRTITDNTENIIISVRPCRGVPEERFYPSTIPVSIYNTC